MSCAHKIKNEYKFNYQYKKYLGLVACAYSTDNLKFLKNLCYALLYKALYKIGVFGIACVFGIAVCCVGCVVVSGTCIFFSVCRIRIIVFIIYTQKSFHFFLFLLQMKLNSHPKYILYTSTLATDRYKHIHK